MFVGNPDGSRGVPLQPMASVPTTGPTGTRVTFRPDPQVFGRAQLPRAAVAARLEDLSFLLPGVTFRWAFHGNDEARGGLAARVALAACRDPREIASHAGTFETPKGPIIVEVALGWHQWPADPDASIDSFVNMERTVRHGSHVHGLHDGMRAHFRPSREAHSRTLRAAVAVILSDVVYGSPNKDRLDSPEAREPVARAVKLALEEWEARCPELAATVRGSFVEVSP
jgi:DNA gyrase/topoisomerase IV subunit B